MVGIVLAIPVTAGLGILIVAGVYGNTELAAEAAAGNAGMNAFKMIPVVSGTAWPNG